MDNIPDPQIKIQRQKHRLTNINFLNKYKRIIKSKGIIHLKTDSEFLHGYTLGLIEALNLKLIQSNHDIYLNQNAPEEVVDIKTHYEKIFLAENKKITYLSFQIKWKKNHFSESIRGCKTNSTGKVTTYGAIAKFLGSPSSSRTVGWAMNASHDNQNIPAHRVVNRNGVLTGKITFTGLT